MNPGPKDSAWQPRKKSKEHKPRWPRGHSFQREGSSNALLLEVGKNLRILEKSAGSCTATMGEEEG